MQLNQSHWWTQNDTKDGWGIKTGWCVEGRQSIKYPAGFKCVRVCENTDIFPQSLISISSLFLLFPLHSEIEQLFSAFWPVECKNNPIYWKIILNSVLLAVHFQQSDLCEACRANVDDVFPLVVQSCIVSCSYLVCMCMRVWMQE